MGLFNETQRRESQAKYSRLLQVYKTLKERLRQLLTDKKRLTVQLVTNVDSGLPNAIVAQRQLDEILKKDKDDKAVCFLKLNEIFSLVRRTFSTKVPEWILYQTGVRIRAAIREEGRLYHTRDDEFLIVLESVKDEAALHKHLHEIVSATEKPHILGGYNISLRVNIGVAHYPRDGTEKSEILRSADIALSMATRNQVSFFLFNPSLKIEQMERIEIQNGILLALRAAADPTLAPQFQIYFQPQVEILDPKTGMYRVIGAEALVRWKHPSMGFLSPKKFIPVAEETGLIVPLGAWILHHSIQQAEIWQREGIGHLVMGINLSTRQFTQEDLVHTIIRLTERLKVPRKALKFEITEGTLMENVTENSLKMDGMVKLGFQMMLDDFGTGYSSLNYLRKLPVSTIKIDKTFVDGLPSDVGSGATVKAIVTMAREMHKGIIVEGVEHRDQVLWLYEQGCRVFQGYYFSKPLPAQEFIEYARAYSRA